MVPSRSNGHETRQNGMELSLSQAAKLSGRSKSTIHRAVKSGKISANRASDGTYLINAAELSRVFPLDVSEGQRRDDLGRDETATELARLQEQVKFLEKALDREKEIQSDLMEERNKWHRQATALISQVENIQKKKKWWPW